MDANKGSLNFVGASCLDCKTVEPPLIQIGFPERGHQVWCHLYD